MPTRAVSFLKKQGIPHRIVTYLHETKGAVFAAEAIDIPLSQTVKTLVVELPGKNYGLAMVPGDRQLDVKAAAKAFSAKRLQMAAPAAAERLTGCRVGGISPFGIPRTLPVMIDQRVESYDRIAVNGGRRGLMLLMTPRDAARAARAKWSVLSAE